MGPVGELINAASERIGIMWKEITKYLFWNCIIYLTCFLCEFTCFLRGTEQFLRGSVWSKHHTNAILSNQALGLALWIEDTEQLEPQGGSIWRTAKIVQHHMSWSKLRVLFNHVLLVKNEYTKTITYIYYLYMRDIGTGIELEIFFCSHRSLHLSRVWNEVPKSRRL